MSFLGPLVAALGSGGTGSLLASGVSAAGNLIGNALSGDDSYQQKKLLKKQYRLQDKYQRRATDYQFAKQRVADQHTRQNMFADIRKGALKAGFNPLTALGAPPQTSTVGAPGVPMPPLNISEKPSAIGEAIRAGANTYAATFEDPIEKATRQAQLENLQKRNEQITQQMDREGGGVPSLRQNTTTPSQGITPQETVENQAERLGLTPEKFPYTANVPDPLSVDGPSGTNDFGIWRRTTAGVRYYNPDHFMAEDMEARAAEVGSLPTGVGAMLSDYLYTMELFKEHNVGMADRMSDELNDPNSELGISKLYQYLKSIGDAPPSQDGPRFRHYDPSRMPPLTTQPSPQ